MKKKKRKKLTNAVLIDIWTGTKKRIFVWTQAYNVWHVKVRSIAFGRLFVRTTPPILFGCSFKKKHGMPDLPPNPFGMFHPKIYEWKGWKNRPVLIKFDRGRKIPMILAEPEAPYRFTVEVQLLDVDNLSFLKLCQQNKKKRKMKLKYWLKYLKRRKSSWKMILKK